MKNKSWTKCCKRIYHDEDGWWAELKPGYFWDTDNNTVFNGETYEDLIQATKDIHK